MSYHRLSPLACRQEPLFPQRWRYRPAAQWPCVSRVWRRPTGGDEGAGRAAGPRGRVHMPGRVNAGERIRDRLLPRKSEGCGWAARCRSATTAPPDPREQVQAVNLARGILERQNGSSLALHPQWVAHVQGFLAVLHPVDLCSTILPKSRVTGRRPGRCQPAAQPRNSTASRPPISVSRRLAGSKR